MVTAPAQPPAVDISQLSELAGEDREFVQSVVLSFEKSMAQLLATMHAAASQGEAQQLARAAHQMKGAAANLHATVLSSLAADLEANAKTLSQAQMQERLNRLAWESRTCDGGATEFRGGGGQRASASTRRSAHRRAAQSAQSPRGLERAGSP